MIVQKGIVQAAIEHWLQQIVIGLNFCPFAQFPWQQGRVKIHIFQTDTAENDLYEHLALALAEQIQQLHQLPSGELETTLFVTPDILADFDDYLDALNMAEELIAQLGMEDQFQLASFHPGYQFEGTQPEDRENHTNRSPYPIFHILRQDSLTQAIDHFGDTSRIPETNKKTVSGLSQKQFETLFQTTD